MSKEEAGQIQKKHERQGESGGAASQEQEEVQEAVETGDINDTLADLLEQTQVYATYKYSGCGCGGYWL